jgi:chemosensory pili system protein ChpA (sensor histidine kinase/response regulator)
MPETSSPGNDTIRVAFAPDINPMLAEAFLEEAPLHAARFSQVVERLFGDDPNLDDVVHAQRLAHSLKGSANITGVGIIARITHDAEDILDWLAESAELPPPELRDTLLETADCVSALVDALRAEGKAPGKAPANTRRVLQELEAWREQHAKDPDAETKAGGPQAAPLAPVADAAPPVAQPRVAQPGGGPLADAAPPVEQPRVAQPGGGPVDDRAPRAEQPRVTEPAADAAAAEQPAALRVPVKLVDRLLRLAGEFAISNVQAQGAQRRMTGRANTLREQYHLIQQRLGDLQDVVEIRGVPATRGFGQAGATTVTGTMVHGFDPLELDEYNELHSKSTALAEAVTDFCEAPRSPRP